MISEETKRYLQKKEWSMGHGQCPECCGLKPDRANRFFNPARPEECGHRKDCDFARLLQELGMDVLFRGKHDR